MDKPCTIIFGIIVSVNRLPDVLFCSSVGCSLIEAVQLLLASRSRHCFIARLNYLLIGLEGFSSHG